MSACETMAPLVAADPFFITGPAVISFSGGRTSGYMLWRILQAHGGTLPEDVVVCFANTGREMPATLDFVARCGTEWGVHIRWLEFRWEPGRKFCVEVSHNSASRNGEPFDALIRSHQLLPNPVARFCTQEMKIRTMKRFMQAEYGWKKWTSVVGLRADEPGRVGKAIDPENWKKQGSGPILCPLYTAGIDRDDVLAFWRAQPFDLGLKGPWEGNCDGCFLKDRGSLTRMLRDHPERMEWWAEKEAEAIATGRARDPAIARFRQDRSYAGMMDLVSRQGVLPFNVFDDQTECQWACTD